MAIPEFVNLKLATASPSLLRSSFTVNRYSPFARPGDVVTPRPEWAAAEAVSNLRHVVAGVVCALVIEGAAGLVIFATWNLWHLR